MKTETWFPRTQSQDIPCCKPLPSQPRASKFTPTKLSGQPVKVNGVIIYNFVAQ
jgi:hypothetical protein